MDSQSKSPVANNSFVQALLRRLGIKPLVGLLGLLFVLDLLIPDPLPFLDEIVLAIVTFLVASLSRGSDADEPAEKPPMKNVTPSG